MKDKLAAIIEGHRQAVDQSFSDDHMDVLDRISRELIQALKAGNKILLCGNGGSAADAQHIAAEFIARFKRERRSLPSIALTTDTSILTAVANDYDYKRIFSRQIEGLGEKGDVLIALSTSGNSLNVIEAVEQAKQQGLLTVGFTGGDGGKLGRYADISYIAGSKKTPHIQEIHITTLHAISEVVEDTLFGS